MSTPRDASGRRRVNRVIDGTVQNVWGEETRTEATLDLTGPDAHAEPDLTTWSPAEVDTELARLYGEIGVLRQRRDQMADYVRGEIARHVYGRGFRGSCSAEEQRAVLADIDETPEAERDHVQRDLMRRWTEVEDLQERIDDLTMQMQPYDEEFARRGGWTRAFLVTNANGHVHKDMRCHTCHDTTRYHWVTEMSGKTEADVVEAAGERACTSCYPSAPVDVLRRPTRLFTPDEVAAAKAREEREQAKVAREAKRLEKALLPDGSELTVSLGMRPGHVRQPDGTSVWRPDAKEGFEHFKTLTAARTWLTNAKVWGEGHPSFPDDAVRTVAEAVAAKEGKPVEQVLDEAAKRAAKRK